MGSRRTASNSRSRAAVDPRIPVYLLTGPAGRGKTALVERLLRRRRKNMTFVLALMDRPLWHVASAGATYLFRSPDIARLRRGDLCIDANLDPAHALCQLHLRRLGLLVPTLAYDAVIFDVGERCCAASFAAVMQSDPRLDVTYRIAGIIKSVDVHELVLKERRPQVETIGEADTIVLIHKENEKTGAVRDAANEVRSLNPLASVISIEAFDAENLHPWSVAPGNFSKDEALRLCHEDGLIELPRGTPAVMGIASNIYNDRRSNGGCSDPLRALRIHMQGDVDIMEVMCAVQQLCAVHGRDALRLSAALNVRHADFPVAIDVIGGTLLHPAYHSDRPRTDSDICILGRGLDVSRIMDAFSRCVRHVASEREECRMAI